MTIRTTFVRRAAGLLAIFLAPISGATLHSGYLLFPNTGLNSLQEVNPANGRVVTTIPLPSGYAFSVNGVVQLSTALVRSDGTIFTNALDASANPVVLALDAAGSLLAVQESGGQYLQQLVFDPLDSTLNTVLGGIPFSPEVVAVNSFAQTLEPRVTLSGANFIGLAVHGGYLFCGNNSDGIVHRYQSNGSGGAKYVNVGEATGSGEINGMAFDGSSLYVAQNSSNRIAVFNGRTFGGFLTNGQFNHPSAVFYDSARKYLYVGDQNDGYLTVLTTSGSIVYAVDLGGSGIGEAGMIPAQN